MAGQGLFCYLGGQTGSTSLPELGIRASSGVSTCMHERVLGRWVGG